MEDAFFRGVFPVISPVTKQHEMGAELPPQWRNQSLGKDRPCLGDPGPPVGSFVSGLCETSVHFLLFTGFGLLPPCPRCLFQPDTLRGHTRCR